MRVIRAGIWPSGTAYYLLITAINCADCLVLHWVVAMIEVMVLLRDERSFSVCGVLYRNEGLLHWLRIRSLR